VNLFPNPGIPAVKTGFGRTIDFVMENAVLYYVSCCLLLLGIYSLMHSSWLSGGYLLRYCESYGTFLLYVVLLTAQCLLVLRRLSLLEDGLVMAGMALFLFLDPTFFNNVFYTYKLNVGLEVNSLCLILSMGLYAILKRVGNIPWTRRSTVMTVLAAIFVYYYPLAMNLRWEEGAEGKYFYLLWWMPLVIALLCEQVGSDASAAVQKALHGQDRKPVNPGFTNVLKRRFHVATTLIVSYIVLSHLGEGAYTYSLQFRPEYLTPVFLAAGMLFFKLNPNREKQGRQFIWVCIFLAGCCSANTGNSIVRLSAGVTLASFHFGLGAVGLCMLFFWRIYRHRSWAIAGTLCLLLVVSGSSLSGSFARIIGFHFVPFFFLAIVLAIGSMLEGGPALPTFAGACLLISALSLTQILELDKIAIFLQLWAIWIAMIQWHFHGYSRPRAYISASLVVLCVPVIMTSSSPHTVAWSVDYFAVLVGLFMAGRFLKIRYLLALFVLGSVFTLAYVAWREMLTVAYALRRLFNSGVLMTALAFLLLPLAYYLSTLKMRKREKQA